MAKVLSGINTFLRTITGLAAVGLVGAGAYLGYDFYTARDRQLTEMKERLAKSEEENRLLQQKLAESETMRRLLKVDHRVAFIDVLEQKKDAEGMLQTKFKYTELGEEGDPLAPPKLFEVEGDEVALDGWLVRFNDKYVEAADPLKGKTIYWFKSVYGRVPGRAWNPQPLDEVGSPPFPYRGGDGVSEFEKKIWANFWEYAGSSEKLEKIGARAAGGQANYQKVKSGMRYRVQLRASDGVSIVPEGPIPAEAKEPAPTA